MRPWICSLGNFWKHVSEYISEYTSKYVSEYTSEYMSKYISKLQIQGRMQIFEKMSQKGLNHDLRPELETRGKMLQIPLKIMDLGAFCVELWSFYSRKRLFVPMSYIMLL